MKISSSSLFLWTNLRVMWPRHSFWILNHNHHKLAIVRLGYLTAAENWLNVCSSSEGSFTFSVFSVFLKIQGFLTHMDRLIYLISRISFALNLPWRALSWTWSNLIASSLILALHFICYRIIKCSLLIHHSYFVRPLLGPHFSQCLSQQVVPVGYFLCTVSLEVGRDGDIYLIRGDFHLGQHIVNKRKFNKI